jgi:hypothetical protein
MPRVPDRQNGVAAELNCGLPRPGLRLTMERRPK